MSFLTLKVGDQVSNQKKTSLVRDGQEMQYTDAGGVFVRCGRTVQKMEPGFYDVVDMGQLGFGLKAKDPVSDDLIDIPGTIADEIFADIGKFLTTQDQYARYGLTHKRGYLFYGPPGSGKTSLGMMLARRFIDQVGGVVMYAGGFREFYNGVAIMRDVEPGRPSMYLIEEAELIVNNGHCLSILDGELSIQGAVFVAMTNYKDQLPPRIANRPGRFDRVEMVAAPPEAVQMEYLRRVNGRGPKSNAPEKIVEALRGLPISMAHLREAFISHVLMGVPVSDVRIRFEIMAGLRTPDGASKKKAGFLPDAEAGDEPKEDSGPEEEDTTDWALQNQIDDAKEWHPEHG